MLAISDGFWTVAKDAGWRWADQEQFGPSGVHMLVTLPVGRQGSVIITQADHGGIEWIHASVALADSMPTYADLATLHRAVFGRRRWAYQLFAPQTDHVNIHEHALHLWGRADGLPSLPNFGARGSI